MTTLPSSTMAAWVTAFTGVAPAEHGVTGNEFFVRERRALACPAPVSFRRLDTDTRDLSPIAIDKLVDAPTVYERLRARRPDILIGSR